MAAVRAVRREDRGDHPTLVRAMRATDGVASTLLRRLSAATRGGGTGAVPVRGSGGRGDPGDEVLGMARAGPAPGGSHDRGPRARRGHRHLGPPIVAPSGPARFRPGRAPGAGGGRPVGASRGPAASPGTRDQGPGAAHGGRSAKGPGRGVRRGPRSAPAGSACGRRPDDRFDRGGLRRGPAGLGDPAGGRPDRGPLAGRTRPLALLRRPGRGSPGRIACDRARAWVCGCPGDHPPLVDARRRRHDPRKATIGC
jgi:hypothetical protein